MVSLMMGRLHAAISAVCPIHGVSGAEGSITISYQASATGPQQSAALAVVATFDWSQAAQTAWMAEQNSRVIGRLVGARKLSDQSTVSTTFVDCTELAFMLTATTHYIFRFNGAYSTGGATTGIQISVNGPASSVFMTFTGQIYTTTTTTFCGVGGAYDVAIAATASAGAALLPFSLVGSISTGTTGGVFVLRFRSETGTAVTIKRGSIAELSASA